MQLTTLTFAIPEPIIQRPKLFNISFFTYFLTWRWPDWRLNSNFNWNNWAVDCKCVWHSNRCSMFSDVLLLWKNCLAKPSEENHHVDWQWILPRIRCFVRPPWIHRWSTEKFASAQLLLSPLLSHLNRQWFFSCMLSCWNSTSLSTVT